MERHLALEGDAEAAALAREIVANVAQHRDTLDEQIAAAAPQYPVVQLARMDRALLRCGLCEVLHSPATPARVAIAEWVELARTYSGEPMRRLMNGVLGRVAREQDARRAVGLQLGEHSGFDGKITAKALAPRKVGLITDPLVEGQPGVDLELVL